MKVTQAFANCGIEELKALLDGGTLTVYSVARPFEPDLPVDRSGVLAAFTFASPAFGPESEGLESPAFVENPVAAKNVGTPGFARACKADGTVVADFSAGPGIARSNSTRSLARKARRSPSPSSNSCRRARGRRSPIITRRGHAAVLPYPATPDMACRGGEAGPWQRVVLYTTDVINPTQRQARMSYRKSRSFGEHELARRASRRTPVCGFSIALGITSAPISTAGRNTAGAICPVPFTSTSITWRTSPIPCRTCCRRKPISPRKIGLLGIGSGDQIIVYDRLCGGSAAARAWWMFRVFGHDNVAMLDGGYGKWTKEKLPTEMSPVRPEPRSFTATFSPSLVRTLSEMQANLASGAEQVIDARGPGKFDGTQEDLFPTKKLGHIPNAINIPWADLIDPESGAFIRAEAIEARFKAAGIDLSAPNRHDMRLGDHLLRRGARTLPARP